MNPVLIAVIAVGGLGLVAGLVLAVASVVMAVPRDEKVEAVRALLPGANCGACGFSGCDAYAHALAHEGAANGLCIPGGNEVAGAVGEYLGIGGADVQAKVAAVRCGGCDRVVSRKLHYDGLISCAAASQHFGGDLLCPIGCLGYGDCAVSCPYHAIKVENGLTHISPDLCRGCGLCVSLCPKHLIELVPKNDAAIVRCSNHAKGAEVRKACKNGCIGCQKCVKTCPAGAITVENFLARVDPDLCTGCGACIEACPSGCIEKLPITVASV